MEPFMPNKGLLHDDEQNYLLHSHRYHAVNPSPWPLFMSMSLFQLVAWLALIMHNFLPSGDDTMWFPIKPIYLGLILGIIIFSAWIRDVIREGTFAEHHTRLAKQSIRLGMLLFIVSEMFFFLGFFWAYFHAALAPSIAIGSIWPPKGIPTISAYEIPLLNTIILLSSGAFITLAHHKHLEDKREYSGFCLLITIFLAILFTRLQIFEYFHAAFDISDSVYGSCFYLQRVFTEFM